MNGPSESAGSFLGRARPLIGARLVAAMASFAIPLVLARALSQREYGTYKQLIMVAQTLFYVLPLGMTQSLYYFLPRDGRDRRTYPVQALLFLATLGALAAAALLGWAGRIAGWVHCPQLPRYAPAVAVYLFGLMVSSILETGLTARGRTTLSSLFYLGSEVLKTAAMTLPIALGRGLPGVFVGLAAFATVRLVATLWLVSEGEGPLVEAQALRAQLRWALPFGIAIAIAVPQQYFHQYVVSWRFDSAAFAIYSVGLFNLPVVDLLYTPTSEVLMVSVGELEREGRLAQAARVFRSAVSRLGYAFLPLTMFLVVFAPELIVALFTQRYRAAVPIFRIGAVSTLLAMFPMDGVLRARGETWHIFRANVLKAVVTVPVALLAVLHFGLLGGVSGWLFCEFLGKAYLLTRVPRALQARLGQLIPLSDLIRAAAASGLAVAAGLLGRALAPGGLKPFLLLAVCGAGFGAGYLAALPLVGSRIPDAVPWFGRPRIPRSPALNG